MAFRCKLMADPVFASDGFTYERAPMELWMKSHATSPITNQPLAHKMLTPDIGKRALVSAWCKQNGGSAHMFPTPAPNQAVADAGAAAPPLFVHEKHAVVCQTHPMEQLRAFCLDCGCAVCMTCTVDPSTCKKHATVALDNTMRELKTEIEQWSRAQEECRRSAEQLCATIQTDADAKKQVIDAEAALLKLQVLAASEGRAFTMGAIAQKRQLRQELVAAAVSSTDVGQKGSIAAAIVAITLGRTTAPVPPASAAMFHSSAAPAAAVGRVSVADAVIDPESQHPPKRHCSSAADAVGGGFHPDHGSANQLWIVPDIDDFICARWQAPPRNASTLAD